MGYATVKALTRWKTGHKAFLIHLQGLIVALRRFRSAIEGDDLDAADDHLRAAAGLMFSSAALMRFTGDFDRQAYETVVRPSMCPPNTIEGFSGLLSRDHREVVRLIGQLKPIFAALPKRLHDSRQLFLAGAAAVYESHKYVCELFGGGATNSLRMNESSEKSSVGLLDIFKVNRLRPVEGKPPGRE
jgi:hypothetical protein